jgi:adenosylcobinamide-phosphate synthase
VLAATAAGTVIGLALDRVVGEPPAATHPVALAGRGLSRLEERTYRPRRVAGAAHVAVAVAAASGAGIALDRCLGRLPATALTVWISAAPTLLGRMAVGVGRALDAGDLERARTEVGGLVGRNVSQLDEIGVARAAVESVAENSVDAAASTVFWALAAGPAGVLTHRVVNTLDAMIGHRDERYHRFGWAAARLDDVLNWAPARLTAATVAVVAGAGGRCGGRGGASGPVEVLATVRRDAGRHPSPNGGVVEAAFAAALGRSLGGVNHYGDRVEDRGRLGNGPPAGPETIGPAVRLLHRIVWAQAAVALAITGAIRPLVRAGRRAP